MTDTTIYRTELDGIKSTINDTSFVNSKNQFNEFIQEFSSKNTDIREVDPQNLDETIKTYTDRFDALKFLFLEQEAKEQFLRLILEQNTKHIDRAEILKSVEEGNELKKTLEDRKLAIDTITANILSVSNVNHEKLDAITNDEVIIDGLIGQIDKKTKQLKQLDLELNVISSQDPSDNRLKSMKLDNTKYAELDLSDLDKDALKAKIQEFKNKRELVSAKFANLKETKERELNRIQKDRKRHTHLTQENDRLVRLVENFKKLEGEQDGEVSKQKQDILDKEEKLTVLVELWKKFSDLAYFKFEDNTVHFRFKQSPLECTLVIGDNDQIKNVSCDGIPQELLSNIMITANTTKEPLLNSYRALQNLSKST